MEGSIVTQPITPKITPFAITTPISRPRVKLMKQSAINPAIVVMDEPITDCSVMLIAAAMADRLSPGNVCCFSLKLCHRKIE